VVGRVNNQTFIIRLAQDRNRVHITFKEHILEMWKTFVYVGSPSKNNANEDIIITQDFQRERL
jgi:hypothetical protein